MRTTDPETHLKPLNAEEAEHEGDLGDVVLAQTVAVVQGLAGQTDDSR